MKGERKLWHSRKSIKTIQCLKYNNKDKNTNQKGKNKKKTEGKATKS